ncbi:monovalent cation:proton antiporter-2 (CPA2) family protein [Agrobacterium genomosp. 13]|uniref:Glutathione-regulated potassium-efflux system protein n=1 Tax=Agrobacterium genomosp. 13 str. CFBP 6927 TaxID=1183428 RepID=A0ABP2BNA0_9HYPH|nr:monovalent cation:proton antiporter-2 (CPA2) family protein [Agrobacterium genomosp. 13]CUX58202.1 Glutathione-regulated potassium-efflux system protein [Agrobacterium genomosp. 13 str. CFBP 6927]
MASEAHGMELLPIIGLLSAAIVAAPLFKRLGFGSVLGYLAGGVVIGPFGARLLDDPAFILNVAELGVVMFLFIIGLEMRPSRLWGLRREIFGLGVAQVGLCAMCLTAVGVFTGFPLAPSFVAGAGFVLTSTAVVMQLLEERGEISTPKGQRIVSILLLEDMSIVPLLALVAFLAPIVPGASSANEGINWLAIGIGITSIAGLVLAGRYLLNPLFGVIASAGAREVMTAAALLVVLGSAYVMQLGGLSMAMGAFLAGVLLSESTFRHQLEADVEPFRGILLGLFFLAVGMSLDLTVIANNWRTILFYVVAYMVVKAIVIYVVARLLKSSPWEALQRSIFMAQGGEFAFVLYTAALAVGILTLEQSAILTSIIIISMALTPILITLLSFIEKSIPPTLEEAWRPENLKGSVLIIGFGRVGQIVSQLLLDRGHDISIIDTDVEMINIAREFDFEVYYGDGKRLDILHAAGAERAKTIIVCVDKSEDATRIVELVKAEFPSVPVLARAVDRRHALTLQRAGSDFHIRETFESAVVLGQRALEMMGAELHEIDEIANVVRQRDAHRFQLEKSGGLSAGKPMFSGKRIPREISPDV